MKPIPLFSAAAANAGLDLVVPITRVLDRHWYVLGEEVAQFEAEFARFTGSDFCVTVANGTDALELSLRALNVQVGDRVVCAANAGFYGSTACHAIGAEPLFVDVSPSSLTLDPDGVAFALRQRPAAVIVTHLYGQLADVEVIAAMCREAGVPLIEDCAQSHGASRGGAQAGSFGQVGCFSFYPTKNLGALGDGGAVVTSDPAVAEALRQLRQYGWKRKYEVARAGGRNSRLDELQAAVLRAKLPHLDRQNALRRAIARRYNAAFADLPLQCPPSVNEDFVAHLYVVRTEKRDALRAHLAQAGIATDVHYPIPDHRQPAYVHDADALAVTEQACEQVVSLPCYPGLGEPEVERVIGTVHAFFA